MLLRDPKKPRPEWCGRAEVYAIGGSILAGRLTLVMDASNRVPLK